MAVERIIVLRGLISLMFGGALAFLPFLFQTLPDSWLPQPLDQAVSVALGLLCLPGLVIARILAGGSMHGVSLHAMVASNVLVYSLIANALLRRRCSRFTPSKAA